MEYKCKQNYILDGVIYKSHNGIVDLPKKIDGLTAVEEPKEELILDEKEELIKIANESGLGSPSTLRRLTIETLKQKIEESK